MAFQQALSGLSASSRNLEVIGNNIANANTIGAKSSSAEFADIYANSLSGTSGANIGIGVNVTTVAQSFTQGGIETTGNPLDVAINGKGFFQMQPPPNTSSGTTSTSTSSISNTPTYYTRDGEFKTDSSGNIINAQGYQLVGLPAGSNISGPLQVPSAGILATQTANIGLQANFDSTLPVAGKTITGGDETTTTINTADATTYNNATSTSIYDDKGQKVTLTYYFQKINTDTWNVYATANGATLNTGIDTTGALLPLATVQFPANGSNPINGTAPGASPPYTAPGVVTSYSWAAGPALGGSTVSTAGIVTLPPIPSVKLDPKSTAINPAQSDIIPAISLDLSKTTESGSAFAVTQMTADGNAPGKVVGVTIQADGTVVANYSNGQTKSAGLIQLATFTNEQGLQPIGGNLWAATVAAGTPTPTNPGVGTAGALQSGALEQSNVDLTSELVNMITAQRSYQANAQTIKSEDQMMQTLLQLPV